MTSPVDDPLLPQGSSQVSDLDLSKESSRPKGKVHSDRVAWCHRCAEAASERAVSAGGLAAEGAIAGVGSWLFNWVGFVSDISGL